MKHEELTSEIIGIFYRVYNVLGYGFLEKVYENALAYEFRKAGLKFGQQVGISVLYEGEVMGDYFADFIVEGKVVVEVKAIRDFGGTEEAQLLNYLKATGNEVGLLLNFGKDAKVKRMVFD
ncbi:MAG TPA: GxxExxY protein [Candidatus Pacearchaeota archaeon]|nr:GxxExxY protein [Candidatus Pacearchaeota archaeon]